MGTGVTCEGEKMLSVCAATSATSTAAAASAATSGRETGRQMGRRNPNLGCAAGAAVTRLNADATSTLSAGTARSPAMAAASSACAAKRALHSGQSA
jgi:hypothetical protein